MYDLVLINPPTPDLVNAHAQQPMGIMYIAAVAEREGAETRICNLAGAGMEPAVWDIPLAAVYGITGTFLNVEAVNAVAQELKRRNRRCRVIVGGPIVLSLDELQHRWIDTVVFGEGENSIEELLRRHGPAVVHGTPADVASLPMPARHLWGGPFGGNVFIAGENYFGGGSATLLTSRGCPYNCAFCAGPELDTPKMRFRGAASVAEEMERLVLDFGVRQFRLCDEFFTAKRTHCFGLCDEIRKSRILEYGKKIAWRASIGVNPHDYALFRTLRTSGCREVSLGVETADPKVMELLTNKGTVDDARAALNNAHAAGLRTRALFMVGLPGSTRETMKHNLQFFRDVPSDAMAVTIFTPVPGCAIAKEPERFGCKIIPERMKRSLCVYGPDGYNELLPTIKAEGLSDEQLTHQIRATLIAAEATGKMGKG